MLIDTVCPGASDAEMDFTVHFVTHGKFKLGEFLELVNERYPLIVTEKSRSGVTTVAIRMRHSHLRLLIAILPKYVGVSYEPA